MRVISSEKIPIKLWIKEIEEGALSQAKNLANLPFAFKHVAIMPDVHQGYGMPIGGVLATTDVIIPNAVGVDIGCGLQYCNTSIPIDSISTDLLKKIMGRVREVIPVGFNHHKEKQEMPFHIKQLIESLMEYSMFAGHILAESTRAQYQLGTLGGGNHFIEFQKDEKNSDWHFDRFPDDLNRRPLDGRKRIFQRRSRRNLLHVRHGFRRGVLVSGL